MLVVELIKIIQDASRRDSSHFWPVLAILCTVANLASDFAFDFACFVRHGRADFELLSIRNNLFFFDGVASGSSATQKGCRPILGRCGGLLLTVLGVISQWLCPERSFLFLISFSWTQYPTLNTIIYLVHCINILLYIPHFSSISNDLWRRGEAKLLSAMAKWQITGARQLHISRVRYCTRNHGNIKIDILLCKPNYYFRCI